MSDAQLRVRNRETGASPSVLSAIFRKRCRMTSEGQLPSGKKSSCIANPPLKKRSPSYVCHTNPEALAGHLQKLRQVHSFREQGDSTHFCTSAANRSLQDVHMTHESSAHLVVQSHNSFHSLVLEVGMVVLWHVRHVGAHLERLRRRPRERQKLACKKRPMIFELCQVLIPKWTSWWRSNRGQP